MKTTIVQLLICGAFIVTPVYAVGASENALGNEASLHDFATIALHHNPGLKSAYYAWQADLTQVAQARALPEPRLSYAAYIESVETRVGPQEQRFALSQAIPWIGTLRLRRDAATQAAEASRQRYEAAKRKLVRDVKKACLEYAYLERANRLNVAHHNVYVSHERAAESRLSAGMPLTDLIKLQIEHDQLMDRLYALRDHLPAAAAKLNILLNRAADAKLPTVRTAEPGEAAWIEAIEAAELMLDHPVLLELDAALAREETRLRLAGKRKFPTIELNAAYIQTGAALDRSVPDSGKDPVMVGLAIKLPIWRGVYRAREDEARLRGVSLAGQRTEQANRLETLLHDALFARRNAERRLRLYRDQLLPEAGHGLRAALAGYKSGRLDFPMLLHAEHRVLDFEMGFERAVAEYGMALTDIEMLAGLTREGGDAGNSVEHEDGGE